MKPYDVKKQMEKLLKSYEQYTRLQEEITGSAEEETGEYAGSDKRTTETGAGTKGTSTTPTR